MRTESNVTGYQNEFFLLSMMVCFLESLHDPLFLLRLPIIREVISLVAIAIVGWRTGPSYPYTSSVGKLILGGMPYEGSALEKKIMRRAGMVVSMVTPFEAAGRHLDLFSHPLPTKMSFWTTHGVSYQHLPMQDLSVDVRNQDAIETLKAMHECIKSDKRVYLHCQAGQGRSFIMCMAYLLIFGYPKKASDHRTVRDYQHALSIIKNVRPQVDATDRRRKKIEEIVEAYRTMQMSRVKVSAM